VLIFCTVSNDAESILTSAWGLKGCFCTEASQLKCRLGRTGVFSGYPNDQWNKNMIEFSQKRPGAPQRQKNHFMEEQ